MKNKITLLLFTSFILALAGQSLAGQSVFVHFDQGSAQSAYAAGQLRQALEASGYQLPAEKGDGNFVVRMEINETELGPEAFDVGPASEQGLQIQGGDGRGVIYGSLAVVEQLKNGKRLEDIPAMQEAPHLEFRAIKHNLSWDSYRPSSALDQHEETLKDLAYWESFLDQMAYNRFNAITLWNLHPFTYMIMPKNFPEASPFTEEEMEEWRNLYQGIFRMAKERGIDSYIVNWNIFVSREFAEAHNVAANNHYPHYFSDGDTSEIIKRYIRECVTQVLEEYPDLTGIGFSHGEGMGGMTPRQRQDWLNDTIIKGMKMADRKSKLIHRVPFSAGTGSGGSVSFETEKLTRKTMEELGDTFDGPIWVEMKFNWSHAFSTPKLVKVHGGELGDTYFKPEPENYKVTWMARNEDFFALRWGQPDFIRTHIAMNAAEPYVGGYFVGSETYIPAKDYFTAIDEPVDWTYAFERQWLFYKQWGRLLYNPDTPDAIFQQAFTRRYGEQAANLQKAYAHASTVPLRLASLYDSTWDFTLYSEGFMALGNRQQGMSYISVDRLINRQTLDPDYVSVKDFVKHTLADNTFEAHKIIPPVLVQMLEDDCNSALELVAGINVSGNVSLMYEVSDVKAWAYLGLHLANKLKGAVHLELFRQTGIPDHKDGAIRYLEQALEQWDKVIEITRPIYRDMPLVHKNAHSRRPVRDNAFHWELIRDSVARDVQIARDATF